MHIWDVRCQVLEDSRHSRQYSPNTTVSSVKFFPGDSWMILAGVGGRYVQIMDLRDQPSSLVYSYNSPCAHSLSMDLDSNYFGGYSDKNTISIWDRRSMKNEILLFNDRELTGGVAGRSVDFHYSNSRSGLFAVLSASGVHAVETAKIGGVEDHKLPSLSVMEGMLIVHGKQHIGKSDPNAPRIEQTVGFD